MKIRVNGQDQEVAEGLGLAALLAHLGLVATPVAVERNGRLVPRAEHAHTRLEPGDRLEIVTLVGGG